jgi:hypothetical protein
MTDAIQPFHRIHSSPRDEDRSTASGWTLRLMRLHLGLAGVALLVGTGAVLGLTYSDLSSISVSGGLRITNPGDIYEQSTQVQLALAVFLALISLVPFRAVNLLAQRRRHAIPLARITAFMLLAGFPMSFFLWRLVANLPDDPDDMTTVQQVINDVSLAVLIAAGLLLIQSALAVWYQVWLFLPVSRRALNVGKPASYPALRWLLRIGIGLWLLVIIGLGVALGVLTDWLYELPVSRPDPGALLYATTFEAFNDEWDLYPGRDAAQIMNSQPFGLTGPSVGTPALAGDVLWIKYGSGASDAIVWSTLDRKFNDLDLRVTTQQVSGALDQNQFGVIFRYRDLENFYIFRITSDGYYSLAKVKNGAQERVSDWGVTELIHQGSAANEIRVVARGDTFRFFINGQAVPLCLKGQNTFSMWREPGVCFEGGELTTLYRDRTFKQGRIALAAGTFDGSDIEVIFDDLVILGPEPDVMEVE